MGNITAIFPDPFIHVILTPSITVMSVIDNALAFASPNLAFTDK